MDVLVMGGTRFMGPAVVRELLQRGHLVTVFNRGSRTILWDGPVREVVGDRDRVEDLAQLRDAAFDAVIDLSAYQPEQTMNLLAILGRTPRLVHCSTGAVYAPQAVLPWPETTPYGPWSVWGAYARSKLECENVLHEHRAPEQSTLLLR